MQDLCGEWTGIATLLTDGFGTLPSRNYRFILSLTHAPDGVITGMAQSPDMGVVQMTLEAPQRTGDQFSCGISALGARYHARITEAGEALEGELEFARGSVSLLLRRDDPRFRIYEIPRQGESGERCLDYDYHPPASFDDGWEISSLDAEGISEAAIGKLMSSMLAEAFPKQASLLVVRNGKLVLEEYFRGQRREQTHTFQSATKSIASMGVGLAVDRGLIDIDAPAYEYFPERANTRWVREKYPITVKHVLTMSAGLDWNETLPYVDPRNDNRAMNASGDWIGYVLERAIARPPGEASFYCSGLSILLGGIVKHATGVFIDEYVAEHLFAPLGIENFGWGSTADGARHTGGGLHMRPRDMAKLAQLILDGGRWQGRELLSGHWVRKSTSPAYEIAAASEALSRDPAYQALHYGYQWWLPTYKVGGKRVDTIEALGYGGQCACIVPSLGLVVVLNSGDYEGDRTRIIRMIRDEILPAVMT